MGRKKEEKGQQVRKEEAMKVKDRRQNGDVSGFFQEELRHIDAKAALIFVLPTSTYKSPAFLHQVPKLRTAPMWPFLCVNSRMIN